MFDEFIQTGSNFNLKYNIKCTLQSFKNYCADSGGMNIVIKGGQSTLAHHTLKDFHVLNSPPVYRTKVLLYKGQSSSLVAGSMTLLFRIVSVQSNIPMVVRNKNIKTIPDRHMKEQGDTPTLSKRHPVSLKDTDIAAVAPETNTLNENTFISATDRISLPDREPPLPESLDFSRASIDPFMSPKSMGVGSSIIPQLHFDDISPSESFMDWSGSLSEVDRYSFHDTANLTLNQSV
jgi:hypothetical protein